MKISIKKILSIVLLLNNAFIQTMDEGKDNDYNEKIKKTLSQDINNISNSCNTAEEIEIRNAKLKQVLINFLENNDIETCLNNLTTLPPYLQELLHLEIIKKYDHQLKSVIKQGFISSESPFSLTDIVKSDHWATSNFDFNSESSLLLVSLIPSNITHIFDIKDNKIIKLDDMEFESSFSAFSPDSKYILTCYDGKLELRNKDLTISKVFNNSNGLQENYLEQANLQTDGLNLITAATFSPCGKYLVAASRNKINDQSFKAKVSARIWDIQTDQSKFLIEPTGDYTIYGMTFSPNGKSLAISDSENITFNRSGIYLAINSDKQLLYLKDPKTEKLDSTEMKSFNKLRSDLSDIKSRAFTKNIIIINVNDNIITNRLNQGNHETMTFTPIEEILATSQLGTICFMNINTSNRICLFNLVDNSFDMKNWESQRANEITKLKFNKDGNLLIVGFGTGNEENDGKIKLLNFSDNFIISLLNLKQLILITKLISNPNNTDLLNEKEINNIFYGLHRQVMHNLIFFLLEKIVSNIINRDLSKNISAYVGKDLKF